MKVCLRCKKVLVKGQRKFCSRSCANKYRAQQQKRFCPTCGEHFLASPSQKQKYCCWHCAQNPPLATKTKVCEWCDSAFTVKSRRALEQQRFCSKVCAGSWKRSNRPIIACEQCGKQLDRPPSKATRSHRQFCSTQCFYDWNRQENNASWLGGHDSYRGPNWQPQRTLARKRDNHTCQQCNITESELGKELDVHHIKPYRLFPDYNAANVLDNLRSLCHDCHLEAERPLLKL